jgi:AcrR family transcriptional regulator
MATNNNKSQAVPRKASGTVASPHRAKPAPAQTSLRAPPSRPTFRERMQAAREDAIVEAVNRLLATKGFDAMTVDEVAAEAGIAKASLYRHFESKEALAAAAMVRVLDRAIGHLDGGDPQARPVALLEGAVRWTLGALLRGEMPVLPSENSSLRAALMGHAPYLDRLLAVSERLERWIMAAQADGSIDRTLPPVVVLYTIYARGCDPVATLLQSTGSFSDDEIVEMVTRTCFEGLRAGGKKAPGAKPGA